jgi:hypothetical protein
MSTSIMNTLIITTNIRTANTAVITALNI